MPQHTGVAPTRATGVTNTRYQMQEKKKVQVKPYLEIIFFDLLARLTSFDVSSSSVQMLNLTLQLKATKMSVMSCCLWQFENTEIT